MAISLAHAGMLLTLFRRDGINALRRQDGGRRLTFASRAKRGTATLRHRWTIVTLYPATHGTRMNRLHLSATRSLGVPKAPCSRVIDSGETAGRSRRLQGRL